MGQRPTVKRGSIALLTVGLAAGSAAAHPHQDIEQQVLLSVGTAQATVQVRIVPSYVDGDDVFAHIDSDGDRIVSESEARAFGARIVSQSALYVDGKRIELEAPRVAVPALEWVSAGLGMIEVDTTAAIPLGRQSTHTVAFEIAYEDLAHDWFVQPFYYPDLMRMLPSQTINRSDAGNHVEILLGP